MDRCPFLSSCDVEVECFKECAFYNYNGGECPFKELDSYKHSIEEKFDEVSFDKSEFSFIKDYYDDAVEQYL